MHASTIDIRETRADSPPVTNPTIDNGATLFAICNLLVKLHQTVGSLVSFTKSKGHTSSNFLLIARNLMLSSP